MIDKRIFTHFDWVLFLMIVGLAIISIAEIYSASHGNNSFFNSPYVLRQAVWFMAGIVVFFVVILIDFHIFERWALFFYWLVNIILVYVLFEGKLAGGSQRWISLGFANIQPSELAKISVILILARHYSRNMFAGGLGFKQLFMPMVYVGIPFMLIASQPDLGTAGILVLIAAFMTMFVKIEKKTFYSMVALVLLIGIPFFTFFFKRLSKRSYYHFFKPRK